MVILEDKKLLKKSYSTRKKRRNIKQIEKLIVQMEHYKISDLLKDSTLSKNATKKLVEVNDYERVIIMLTKIEGLTLHC